MSGVNELKIELEKINKERDEIKRKKNERRMLPLTWDRHIRKAIGFLFRYGQLRVGDLAERLKIHVKDVDYVVNILERNGLIIKRDIETVITTEEGSRIAKELGFKLQLQSQKDRLLPPYLIKDIENSVSDFTKVILPPNPYLFQWYFTPHSVQNILEYMIEEFDVEGRNVACVMAPTIGLSLFLTGYTGSNGEGVYVFDKDKSSVEELRRRGVHAVEYDVAEAIPDEFRGFFDCVIIDPPYDEDYYFVSLSRAIDLLGGEQYKTIYIVVPPPEIAYLRRIGFPPMMLSVLHLLDRCWLLFENVKKGLCRYLSPPYEVAALSVRLDKKSEDINGILENWRSSDLIKASIFRDVVPPLPGRCELPLESYMGYERHKRRFLEKSAIINTYKEYVYTKPELEIQNAAEWDEFMKEFSKPLLDPYYVFVHDIGDWDDPANRLIKMKGIVAHFIWQKVKKSESMNKEFIFSLSSDIKQEFLHSPSANQIKSDVENFILNLNKIKLI